MLGTGQFLLHLCIAKTAPSPIYLSKRATAGAALLYHFTNIQNLKNILIDNELKMGSHDNVSLTGKKDLLKSIHQIRFTLDSKKLKQNYEITPVNELTTYDAVNSENEYRILENVKNLKEYVTSIDINQNISIYLSMIKSNDNTFDSIEDIKTFIESHNLPMTLID